MRVKRDINMLDLWKYYKKNCDNPISREQWEDLLFSEEGLIKELTNYVIVNAALLTLPHNMGSIFVRQRVPRGYYDKKGNIVKNKSLVIDWDSTKKMWKENPETRKERKFIYYFNAHTRGLKYNITWDKELDKKNLMHHIKYYNFQSHRSYKGDGFRESLTKHIKSPDFKTVYFEQTK
jgi:hypothetical protein